jgi:branched-subunit amino acid ABC-type transport system permease component
MNELHTIFIINLSHGKFVMLGNYQFFHSHGLNISKQSGVSLTYINPHIGIIQVDYHHHISSN